VFVFHFLGRHLKGLLSHVSEKKQKKHLAHLHIHVGLD